MIIWKTGHHFNEAVLCAMAEGFASIGVQVKVKRTTEYDGRPVESLSYGVLRGGGKIYHDCDGSGVEWWNIDKGFFGASHFDGYYRLGYRHLQPLYREGPVDPSRWERLKVKIEEPRLSGKNILICPPTDEMSHFYGVGLKAWLAEVRRNIPYEYTKKVSIRRKTTSVPLEKDMKDAALVVVYNSNVATQALLSGIPVIAQTGMVRSWNRLGLPDISVVLREKERYLEGRLKLFQHMACRQFTLDEMRSGFAWETSQRFR